MVKVIMVKGTIEYADGTKEKVKKKSYGELADYYEKQREHGAIGFDAKCVEDDSKMYSREYKNERDH